MNVIICDNDSSACDILERQISSIDSDICIIKLLKHSDVYGRVSEMDIDAVFMDIEFSNGNDEGICTASKLLNDFPELKVIFFTGYSERYIEQIFTGLPQNNPYGIIKKPVDITVTEEYIRRLKNSELARKQNFIRFKDMDRGFVNIDCRTVKYISSFKRLIDIHLTDDTVFTGYGKLGDMYSVLSKVSDDFFYCHKSYIINLRCVTSIPTGENAVMIGNQRIALSSINGTTASAKKKIIIKYNSK